MKPTELEEIRARARYLHKALIELRAHWSIGLARKALLFRQYMDKPWRVRFWFFGRVLSSLIRGRSVQLSERPLVDVPVPIAEDLVQALERAGAGLAEAPQAPPTPPVNETDRWRIPRTTPLRRHGRRRVAYLTNQLFDVETEEVAVGGGERYALALAHLLRRLGLEVTFFQVSVRPYHKVLHGFPVVGLGGSWRNCFGEFLHGVCSAFTEMTMDFDHVIHNLPELSSGQIRSDALTICHGLWFDHDFFPYGNTRSREWYNHLRRAFGNPALVVSVDCNSINYARATWPEIACRMHYIPNFFDGTKFFPRPSTTAKKPLILFPRRASVTRGARLLQEIAARIPHDVEFCWVGEGCRVEAKAISELSKTDPRISFHAADFDEMPEWYAKAHIVVIPTVASEGTSLSCIEALASGCAVVSTWVGGLPELVRDGVNGVLVEPTASALAEGIKRLLDDPEERLRLAQHAAESVVSLEASHWERKWAANLLKLGWVESSKVADALGTSAPPLLGAGHLPVRTAIVTRNGVYGGVESLIAVQRQGLGSSVIVAGGLDFPELCPFPYKRVQSYQELRTALKGFDAVIYHWAPHWAVEAISDSGLPSVEFVHGAHTSESDKSKPTLLVTHSGHLADQIKSLSGRECRVVPHPVDTQRFTPGPVPGKYVGGLTSYYPVKGLELFVRAWADLSKEFPQLRARFYGVGPEQERLAQLAESIDVEIDFLGPAQNAPKSLSEFRCVVLPSRMEGLPVSLLEAMACEVPVVASRLPGIEEFKRKAEQQRGKLPLHLFDVDDLAGLKRELRMTLTEPLHPGSHDYVRSHYSQENHCRLIAEAVMDAIALKPPTPRRWKVVDAWNTEYHTGSVTPHTGPYFTDVEGGRPVFPKRGVSIQDNVANHNFFPCFRVTFPPGTRALEWEVVTRGSGMATWQVDWLEPDFSPKSYVADVVHIAGEKPIGGLASKIPPGTVGANISLRPDPHTSIRLKQFEVRALTEDQPPLERAH